MRECSLIRQIKSFISLKLIMRNIITLILILEIKYYFYYLTATLDSNDVINKWIYIIYTPQNIINKGSLYNYDNNAAIDNDRSISILNMPFYYVVCNKFNNKLVSRLNTKIKTSQYRYRNLVNKDIHIDYKVEPELLYSESDEFGSSDDSDFGFSGSYPSYTSGYYNYSDYLIFQSNETDYFKIELISPQLPYYVTENDIKAQYSPNFFTVSFNKARISPNNNIDMYNLNSIQLSDYKVMIYPIMQFNTTCEKQDDDSSNNTDKNKDDSIDKSKDNGKNNKGSNKGNKESKTQLYSGGLQFTMEVEDVKTINSSTQFKITIKVDKSYFPKHEIWKQMYSGRSMIRVTPIKSTMEVIEDQKMQKDSNNVIISFNLKKNKKALSEKKYINNNKDNNKKNKENSSSSNHYSNDFEMFKNNLLLYGYDVNKPELLYNKS